MRYGQGRPIVMLLSEGRQATIKGGLDARCAAAHAVVAGQQGLRPGQGGNIWSWSDKFVLCFEVGRLIRVTHDSYAFRHLHRCLCRSGLNFSVITVRNKESIVLAILIDLHLILT